MSIYSLSEKSLGHQASGVANPPPKASRIARRRTIRHGNCSQGDRPARKREQKMLYSVVRLHSIKRLIRLNHITSHSLFRYSIKSNHSSTKKSLQFSYRFYSTVFSNFKKGGWAKQGMFFSYYKQARYGMDHCMVKASKASQSKGRLVGCLGVDRLAQQRGRLYHDQKRPPVKCMWCEGTNGNDRQKGASNATTRTQF